MQLQYAMAGPVLRSMTELNHEIYFILIACNLLSMKSSREQKNDDDTVSSASPSIKPESDIPVNGRKKGGRKKEKNSVKIASPVKLKVLTGLDLSCPGKTTDFHDTALEIPDMLIRSQPSRVTENFLSTLECGITEPVHNIKSERNDSIDLDLTIDDIMGKPIVLPGLDSEQPVEHFKAQRLGMSAPVYSLEEKASLSLESFPAYCIYIPTGIDESADNEIFSRLLKWGDKMGKNLLVVTWDIGHPSYVDLIKNVNKSKKGIAVKRPAIVLMDRPDFDKDSLLIVIDDQKIMRNVEKLNEILPLLLDLILIGDKRNAIKSYLREQSPSKVNSMIDSMKSIAGNIKITFSFNGISISSGKK